MKQLLSIKNIRKIVYAKTSMLVLLVFGIGGVWFHQTPNDWYAFMNEWYGFLGLLYLGFALAIGPLVAMRLTTKYHALLKRSRRAVGVSSWIFMLLHGAVGFFGLMLGGTLNLDNISFIPSTYIVPLIVGAVALFVMTLLAITSTDIAIKKMGKNWYYLHKLVYGVGVLIFVHIVLISSWSSELGSPKVIFIFVFTALLILLWSQRLDVFLFKRYSHLQKIGVITSVVLIGLSIVGVGLYKPFSVGGVNKNDPQNQQLPSANPHLRHLQSLKNQGVTIPGSPLSALENSKRYNASFTTLGEQKPGTEIAIKIRITNADTGSQIRTFSKVYEKFSHFIIMDTNLEQFQHVHPEFLDGEFVYKTTFSKPQTYQLYLSITPLGDIEQQFAFRLPIGDVSKISNSTQFAITDKDQEIGPVNVSLNQPTLGAKDLTLGNGMMIYDFKDRLTQEPYKDIRPYLGAFGHLTMVNTQTFEAIHVHPNQQTTPKPEDRSDSKVEFVPLGIFKPIEAGTYKLFGEFNLGGEVKLVENVIEIRE